MMPPRVVLFAALSLAGCATILPHADPENPPPEPTAEPATPREEGMDRQARAAPVIVAPRVDVPAPTPANELERLLAYFEQVRKLPAVEVGREHEGARAAFARSRSDFDRMRLAMLFSIPNTPVSDDLRAMEMLDPVLKSNNSGLRGLASLIAAHLQERRRLETGMHGLQQNVQGLQQKLDALMSLERSLIDREQGSPARKR